MSIQSEINEVLFANPICQRGTNEVNYFQGDGWDMLVSTYIGQPGKHVVTQRTILESRPLITLYVSIGSTREGTPLRFLDPRIRGLTPAFETVTFSSPLSSVGGYNEALHGQWTIAARRNIVLKLQGLNN